MAIQQPQAPKLQVAGRRLRTLLLALTGILLLASCHKDDPAQRIIPETADQTILFYIPGTSLYRYYKNNIAEITATVGNDILGSSRILICYQPNSQLQTKAVVDEVFFDPATKGSATARIAEFDDFQASDPDYVSGVFTAMAKAAPARKYGLVVGCHGKAWLPANNPIHSYGMQQAEDAFWKRIGDKQTRAFGDSGYEINITDFATVLSDQTFRFDYLIFDACFMANIETLYDLRKSVDYVVASPCEVMAYGFPYSRVLPGLLTQGGKSYDMQQVCEAFYNFYQNDWDSVPNNEQSGCISLTVTSQLDALASVMQRINATQKVSYTNTLQSYEGLSSHLFFDLGHWVKSAFPSQFGEFTTQFDKAFPKASRLHTPQFYSAYNGDLNPITYYSGISVGEPSLKYTTENKATAWYKATH